MPITIKSIIQQAMLAAAPAFIVGCGPADVHVDKVVSWSGAAPSELSDQECAVLCASGIGVVGCGSRDFKGCTPIALTGDGGLEIDCNEGPPPDVSKPLCTGRRPAGLAAVRVGNQGLARFLAQSAHLEAASVIAFRRLARELTAHGAPNRLVREAICAARDEVRHARVMARLARRYGSRVPRVEVGPAAIRPLDQVASENEVEGCVHETYGAAIATWQARTSNVLEIASAMEPIAHDEARHAQLAWDVRAWALPKLSHSARRRVGAAREAAVHALRIAPAAGGELVAQAGLPGASVALRLQRALETSLWNARA